jgi:hypothetical protein
MGIDIYMRWPNQSEQEKEAQYTGFSIVSGHTGYLREAYHGGPYVTHMLVAEAFESESGEAKIPASVLEERLPVALKLAKERSKLVYNEELGDDDEILDSFREFVALARQKEDETGEPVSIIASY